ncbi:klc-2, partial [Symbiodinium microadriaticum]
QVYKGSLYSGGGLEELRTFDYTASDGLVQVWQHALILCDPGDQESPSQRNLCVLYHYTNELAFRNVANKEQTTAELFASLVDSRAHFGKGVYCTQHEPAVWGSRIRILLNNYSNLSPLRPGDTTDAESQRVEQEWGTGNSGGHRAAFCIPILVSMEIAYNIFEKQAPDLAQKIVLDPDTGEERRINLGEDYRGRKVDPGRDVWVLQVTDDMGKVKHAGAEADGLLRLLRLRLANLRRELGDDAEITLDCMDELGTRLLGRALHEEAEQLYKECLRGRRAKLGEEHPDTLSTMNNLASLLKDRGSYEEAEPLYRQALEICHGRAKLGEEHPETLTSMNNLAVLLKDRDSYEEAEPLHRQGLEICLGLRAKLGEEHPHTLGSMNNLASLLQDRGRYEEAEPLYRQGLEIRKAKLGEEHPHTLDSMNNLALLLQARGRYEEAEPLCRQGLEIRRAKLGEEHPETLTSIITLASLLKEGGVSSFVTHTPALTIWVPSGRIWAAVRKPSRAKLGEEHPLTLTSMNNLAFLLKARGSYEEADPLYRKVLEIRHGRARLGDSHPDTMNSMYGLASLLRLMGQLEEAEQLFREDHETCG